MRHFIFLIAFLSFSLQAQDQLTNFGSLYMHPNSSIALMGNVKNDGSFTGNGGTFILTGSSSQGILGTSMIDIYNFTINNSNAGGVTLSGNNFQVSNILLLTNGKLNTSASNLIKLKDGATSTGGSTISYVNGPIQKIGNDNFTFPVGKGGNYQPISISAPVLVTDVFTGEFFNTNPQTEFGIALESGIDHVSACEYWNLDRTIGTSNVNVTIGWNALSCGVTLPSNLVVAHWDTTQWKNFGNGGITGNSSQGTISTTATPFSFGVFTLASTTTDNPLPIELVEFTAQKNDNVADITWITASERENSYFTIEKTRDGITFETVSIINGKGTDNELNSYSIIDEFPFEKLSYYRLKQTDMDGEFTYSDLKSVYFGEVNSMIVYPNPSNGNDLNILSSSKFIEATITIYDFSGRIVLTQTYTPEFENVNSLNLFIEKGLIPGIYTLQITNSIETIKSNFAVN